MNPLHLKLSLGTAAVIWLMTFIWIRKRFPKQLGGKEAPEVLIFVAASAIAVTLALPKLLR